MDHNNISQTTLNDGGKLGQAKKVNQKVPKLQFDKDFDDQKVKKPAPNKMKQLDPDANQIDKEMSKSQSSNDSPDGKILD